MRCPQARLRERARGVLPTLDHEPTSYRTTGSSLEVSRRARLVGVTLSSEAAALLAAALWDATGKVPDPDHRDFSGCAWGQDEEEGSIFHTVAHSACEGHEGDAIIGYTGRITLLHLECAISAAGALTSVPSTDAATHRSLCDLRVQKHFPSLLSAVCADGDTPLLRREFGDGALASLAAKPAAASVVAALEAVVAAHAALQGEGPTVDDSRLLGAKAALAKALGPRTHRRPKGYQPGLDWSEGSRAETFSRFNDQSEDADADGDASGLEELQGAFEDGYLGEEEEHPRHSQKSLYVAALDGDIARVVTLLGPPYGLHPCCEGAAKYRPWFPEGTYVGPIPLHCVRLPIFDLLVAAGADVNNAWRPRADQDGCFCQEALTPLTSAVIACGAAGDTGGGPTLAANLERVERLLRAGATPQFSVGAKPWGHEINDGQGYDPGKGLDLLEQWFGFDPYVQFDQDGGRTSVDWISPFADQIPMFPFKSGDAADGSGDGDDDDGDDD